MISKEEFISNYKNVEQVSMACLNSYIEEAREAIMNAKDDEARTAAVTMLERTCYDYMRKSHELLVNEERLSKAYDEMSNMIRKLNMAFECEWISDTELAVKTQHENLSDFAYMLADWFNVKSTSGFTFGSSFSTHNAATENGLCFAITCTPDGRGLLQFYVKPQYPYWVSKAFIESYKKNNFKK